MRTTRIAPWIVGLVLLGACQGRTLYDPPRSAAARVNLTDADLAPVDRLLAARNAQWILGDEVEVLASREYFAQSLTVNATLGLVQREDRATPDETTVTLTYVGHPAAASVTTNPRVLVGTGLTVLARRRLVVRLVRTTDPAVPVHLSVTARGDASRGRGEEVTERADLLRFGGRLVSTGGRWAWQPLR